MLVVITALLLSINSFSNSENMVAFVITRCLILGNLLEIFFSVRVKNLSANGSPPPQTILLDEFKLLVLIKSSTNLKYYM